MAQMAASEPWVQVTGSPRLWNWRAEQRVIAIGEPGSL
jgi:hypothetical protein